MTQRAKRSASATPLPSPKERRRLREAKSLSQEQVATAIGVTRATVRSWETGRTNPQGRRRQAYAKLLARIAAEQAKPTDSAASAAAAAGKSEPAPRTGPEPEPEPKPNPEPEPEAATEPEPEAAAEPEAATEPEPEAAAEHGPEPGPEPEPEPAPRPQTRAPKPAPPSRTKQSGAHTRPKLAVKHAAKPPMTLPATAPGPAKARAMASARTTANEPPDPPVPAAPPPGTTAPASRRPPPEQPTAQPVEQPVELTPDEAFDALYAYTAPALVRQAYLLTGRRRLSHESVERAFHLAWQRWPEVAVDRDPVGWVRAAAYEYAMSPWHRLRRAHQQPDSPAMEPGRRALLNALLELPPPYRRTLLLYDGLGLDLPETAAETEASTPAAANRVLHARAAIAQRLPELGRTEVLHERLTALASSHPVAHLIPARAVRTGCERRARFWTRAAITVTTLIIGAALFTMATAPTRYEPPLAPGEQVGGVPTHSGPQRLSPKEKELRKKLLSEPAPGPERLVPQTR